MSEQNAEQPHASVLDSDEQQVAELYGRAVLSAAGEQADEIVSELTSVVDECLNAFPALEQILASPRISQEEKESMLDRVFSGRIDTKLLNFFKVLCRRDRIGYLRGIQKAAVDLRDEQKGRVRVELTSALPLSDEQRSSIVARMGEVLGKEVALRESVDESLLGGIVIRIGDRVFDGSVVGKMESMRGAVVQGVHKAMREKFDALVTSS